MSERYQRPSCNGSRCEPQSRFRPRADTLIWPSIRAMHSFGTADEINRNIQTLRTFAHQRCLHRRGGGCISREASVCNKLSDLALDQLFRVARAHNGWTDRPVTEHRQ
jgi:hypothetical protein